MAETDTPEVPNPALQHGEPFRFPYLPPVPDDEPNVLGIAPSPDEIDPQVIIRFWRRLAMQYARFLTGDQIVEATKAVSEQPDR